jgi:hypothetical protein
VTMRPDLAAVVAAMEARAAASTGETFLGWRHAAQILRLFADAPRALRQLRQHAAFWKDTAPDKAAAYREAITVITRLTRESLAPVIVPAHAPHQQAFAFS